MDFWNRTFLRFTLIEWAVALLILLILARFIWAEEAARFEDSLFDSIGFGGGAKYLITVPLAIWVYYRLFKREQAKARQEGVKVVRPQVLVVSFGLLALAFAILVSSIAGCTEQDRPTLYVSMVQLLANPDDYAGYPVTVTGHLAEDGEVLFLSAEHAQLNDVVAGLPIAIAYRDVDVSEHGIARTGCEDRFVRVLGVFEKRANEYMISSISKISRFDESAGLQFEGADPTGGAVVCWPN